MLREQQTEFQTEHDENDCARAGDNPPDMERADEPRGGRRGGGRYLYWAIAVHGIYWSQEPVASPGHGLDEARIACGIAEGVSQAADRRIEAVIKIDESIGRPEPAAQLFASNDFSGLFKKLGEDLEGLLLQPDFQTLTPQLAGAQVKFEYAKAASSLSD
jgi:hypothetical protein